MDDTSQPGGAQFHYDELSDASNEKLLRLVFAYDRDDDPMSGLGAEAMATLLLRNRGYEFDGDRGSLEVRDPDGSVVDSSQV